MFMSFKNVRDDVLRDIVDCSKKNKCSLKSYKPLNIFEVSTMTTMKEM